MKGSADKGSKQFCALLGSKTPDPTGLGDRGIIHNALGLHFTNGGQRTDEVVGTHLSNALFAGSEFEQFFERKLTGLHLAFDFGTSTSVRYSETRRLHSLFLREVRRGGSHVVRLPPLADFCSGQGLTEIITPSACRITKGRSLRADIQYGTCNIHKHGVRRTTNE